MDERQVFLLLAPMSFDASTFELWAPLLHGAKCVVFPEGPFDLEVLERTIRRHGVTCLWLTAALFNVVIDQRPSALSGVRCVMTGGEALSVPHVRRGLEALPDTRLVNGYGPTECTTFATTYEVPRDFNPSARSVPIGRPIGNTTAYVLDERARPCAVGEPGELYIGGHGLARGYWNRPGLTAERFVPDPFQGGNERLYRTGDRVRRLADGTLDFLGRFDEQIKLRGFRIELGEVESVLGRLDDVKRAAAIMRDDPGIGPHLAAYVVPRPGSSLAPADLRNALRGELPSYMMPSTFVLLDELPVTTNGKLDRRALPTPGRTTNADPRHVPPSDDLEARLTAIWSAVLGHESVGVHDGFFELGGQSLSAIRLIARVRAEFGAGLTVRDLFENPTVAELALRLSAGGAATDRDQPVTDAPGVEPLASYAQERLRFLDRLEPHASTYNVPFAMRLLGEIDAGRLQAAVDGVVR